MEMHISIRILVRGLVASLPRDETVLETGRTRREEVKRSDQNVEDDKAMQDLRRRSPDVAGATELINMRLEYSGLRYAAQATQAHLRKYGRGLSLEIEEQSRLLAEAEDKIKNWPKNVKIMWRSVRRPPVIPN